MVYANYLRHGVPCLRDAFDVSMFPHLPWRGTCEEPIKFSDHSLLTTFAPLKIQSTRDLDFDAGVMTRF